MFQFSPRKSLGHPNQLQKWSPQYHGNHNLRGAPVTPSPAFLSSPVEEEEPGGRPTVLDLEPSCPWVIVFFLGQILLLVSLSHRGLEPCAELTFAVEASGLWGSLRGEGCNRARSPKGVVWGGSIQGKGSGSPPRQGLRPGWDRGH